MLKHKYNPHPGTAAMDIIKKAGMMPFRGGEAVNRVMAYVSVRDQFANTIRVGKKQILDLYDKFILNVIRPLYGEDIVYQKIPTFRLHFPGNIAVGEYHKDKWYRDKKWHEEVCELNFYLPFTKAYGTNTIWVESEEDEGDFQAMNFIKRFCT